METSAKEWELYTTGVKEKLEIIQGLEKDTQRKWALFRSADFFISPVTLDPPQN